MAGTRRIRRTKTRGGRSSVRSVSFSRSATPKKSGPLIS